MTDINAAARIGAYLAERKRHMDSAPDIIHGFGLGGEKVLRASDVRAVLADLTGLTRPERCQDCKDDQAGPCPMCAIAIYGDVDGLAYLDARDARHRVDVGTLTTQLASMLRKARDEAWEDSRVSLAAQALSVRVESGDFKEADRG